MEVHLDKNRGSASLEATLVLPLFIAVMVAVYCMGRCRMAELFIYEAVVESAEYMAESRYINKTQVITPGMVFSDYVDDAEIIEKYVKNGVDGISFLGSYVNSDGEVVVKAKYTLNVDMPFIPTLSKERTVTVKQKGYTGYTTKGNSDDTDSDKYVYVTENREVYHSSRSCTYLSLSISMSKLSVAKGSGYKACEFCGSECGDTVYITDYGESYHSRRNCSGLKRTVSRVKLSEVENLGGCSRCVN
jgi:hypothetical protein